MNKIIDSVILLQMYGPGSHLNIKMSSYQYRDPHVKDKTVSRPSYLQHGNPHTWERRSLYWDGTQITSFKIKHTSKNLITLKRSCLISSFCGTHVSEDQFRLYSPITWARIHIHNSHKHQGAVSIRKTVLPGMTIPMLKIRRPNGRLIFNMEIAIRR